MCKLVCREAVERVRRHLLRRVMAALVEVSDQVVHALILEKAVAVGVAARSGAF